MRFILRPLGDVRRMAQQTTTTGIPREAMIVAHMGFVRGLARPYAARGEPYDDVLQAGMIGLIKAVDRFDPEHGAEFRSFATPTILGEIRRHFRDRTWSVTVPRRVKDDSVAVSQAVERLSGLLGHTPTVTELAEDMGMSTDRVLDALGAHTAYSPDSLSHTPWLDDDERRDIATDEHGFALAEDRAMLGEIMDVLPARERVILHLRFEQGMLQSQIAGRLGISQMHVSRLIARALARLREEAGEG